MSRDETPLIDLQCEAHTYPDGTVGMHDIEFSVYPDEVVALVGGNGTGKSTLLEHLNATLVPDDGELVVDGTPITEDNKAHARKAVGFVFQDADTQLVAPTVLDDVMFGLQNDGVPSDEARERAREALVTVDASHLEDRIPYYLSGGEKRLVKSMEARGYNGDLTLYGDVSRPPIHELFVVVGSYVAVVGYAAMAVYGVGL